MNKLEAYEILRDYQRWRKGEPPYDYDTLDNYVQLDITPKQISDALDYAIKHLGNDHLMDELEKNVM